MKPVVQLERTGCGIASVAALARVSYKQAQQAANRLGVFAGDSRLWSETRYVRRLLRRCQLSAPAQETAFVSWPALPDHALLAIKWHRIGSRASWHWVVFVRDAGRAYVLDSKPALKRHVRTDFGRMRPTWHIPIRVRRER